ncbi:MAG: flagellar hook-basal body complex protein [Planctomycetes bacterium]|nr:flagellar hook-basal body complex protein [Planctomycetota bacterium]
MQRSLFSGVSGLTNHQSILDITASNLANVSTAGYKSSRISFTTAMNQTQSAGGAPSGQTGGVNPRQVGLGVASGSIDVDTRQGSLLSTGRSLDLAIQGAGFFKVTRVNPADGSFYTRVGNFGFDQNDDLVDLASGLRVNGIQQGVQGAISLTQYRSINAQATQTVTFQGNLNANADGLRGSELQSILPLVEASDDRSSFSTGSEATLLKNLTLFRGNATDPGQVFTGSQTVAVSPGTDLTLKSETELTTGGQMRTSISVPAADYSADNLTLRLLRNGVAIQELVIDQDLSAFGSSVTPRTFMLESPQVNEGDLLTIEAEADTAIPVGAFSYDSEVMTNLTVFGTKPNGEAYAGKISVNPWSETVGDLVTKINGVLTQGTRTFATVSVENGNILAKALETGDGFSLFLGEDDRLPIGAPEASSTALAAPLTATQSLADGDALPTSVGPVTAGVDGALRPTFTIPAVDLTSQVGRNMLISVRVNGNSVGSISVPAADYSSANANRVFTLTGYPQVKSTDLVEYTFTGDLDLNPATGSPQDFDIETAVGALSESISALGFNYRGTATTGVAAATMARGGLVQPTFTMPAIDLSDQVGRSLKVSMKINGVERASISIPPADYRGGATKDFEMPTLPHVAAGDVVTFDLSGSLDLGNGLDSLGQPRNLRWSTALVADNDTTSIMQDRSASGLSNGQPDIFEDSPVDATTTDINRWQYANSTNVNFDWYKIRFAAEVVTTSIDVYDTNGTKHNVEARYFKSGSKVDPETGARTNVWDSIANVSPTEGSISGDLITGVQFDQFGRYVGDSTLGTTARGSGLDSNGYRGQPDNNRLEMLWNASGPSQIQVDLGATNGTNGLTGFGSASTAAAINQDGYANGSLDSMSVDANGDIKGLYSNGQSQTIATLQVFTFRNPAGMLSAGGNLWQPSSNSGLETPRQPGQGGAGQITAGSLEGSNVDIASEFTRLITAQRGFQVNARVIQTTDQILQELAGLIR